MNQRKQQRRERALKRYATELSRLGTQVNPSTWLTYRIHWIATQIANLRRNLA